MRESIKECPVIGVKGNKIILGPPGKAAPFRGQKAKGQYRKLNDYVRGFKKKYGRTPTQKELAGIWAFLAPGAKGLWPIIAVMGVGFFGSWIASGLVEKARPFLKGMIPLGVTGLGLAAYSELIRPWIKPVPGEFKPPLTERDYLTAVSRQKVVDTAIKLAAAGGVLTAVWIWVHEYGLLKELDRIKKEAVGSKEIPGREPTAAEKAKVSKIVDLLKTGDIVISVPDIYVLQWWGIYWEGFTLRIDFELRNKSPYTLPYVYLEIEDLDIGYTAVKKPVAWDIEPGETVKISAEWTAKEGDHGNLPYGVPGQAHLLLRLGVEPGQYFMSREVDLVTMLAPHLEKYYSKRHPTYRWKKAEENDVTENGK